MPELKEQVSELEQALMKVAYAQFNTEMELQKLSHKMDAFHDEMKEFKNEMSTFKDEMKVFKDEMKVFKDETRADQKAMNKRWGELANKMGTVVEDIVAPNIRRIAAEYFDCPALDFFAVRIEKRQPRDSSKRREFDVVAAAGDKVFLVETKSTVRETYVTEYIEFLRNREFFAYFPEYEGSRLVAFFASLSVPEDKVNLFSRTGIYVMAMTDTTMDVVNFDRVNRNA